MAELSTECELTTEQKNFLEECLVEFANRYTDEDEEYKKVYDRGITAPPIMSPWSGRPRLTARRSGNRNSYQNRHDGGRNDRDRYDRNNYESRYSRNDRYRDEGHRRYRTY